VLEKVEQPHVAQKCEVVDQTGVPAVAWRAVPAAQSDGRGGVVGPQHAFGAQEQVQRVSCAGTSAWMRNAVCPMAASGEDHGVRAAAERERFKMLGGRTRRALKNRRWAGTW
jgi:hypothetical protein